MADGDPALDLVPIPLVLPSGIQRDGTDFDTTSHIDGLWTRWVGARARKMGGFRRSSRYIYGLPRAINEFTKDSKTYIHLGGYNRIEALYLDGSYNSSVISDRTPAGLTASSLNMWQFAIDGSTAGVPQIVAQVAPNLDCLCNSAGGQLFYGALNGTGALSAVTTLPGTYSMTGGVVALHPYTVVYGSDGFVMWSIPGDPTDYTGSGSGSAYVTRQKIVKGLPLRSGPGNTPAGLLWSADALVSMSYVGGTPVFAFNTISDNISVWSPNSIIEMGGIYYWIGADRFYMFNGAVRELPNTTNSDFFFDGVNRSYRQKTFAMKVPRYGEIWWCFAKDDSEEPNHAIIFNTRENVWYDTELPSDGRCCGTHTSVLGKPVMVGVQDQNYILDRVTSISAAGTGYVAGDILTVVDGDYAQSAQITVSTVNGGGGITAVAITRYGDYVTPPAGATNTPTGGTGTGCQLVLSFATPHKLWVHEDGVNEADGNDERPVRAYYETSDIAGPLRDKYGVAARVAYIVPDFVQTGDMLVTVTGQANARSPVVEGDSKTFPDMATSSDDQVVYTKEQRRILRMRFESNTINGDFRQGRPIAFVAVGDGRSTQ